MLPTILWGIIEPWNFIESLYYSIVTLTSIGFGDFVPGKEHNDNTSPNAPYSFYHHGGRYECLTLFWVLIGVTLTDFFKEILCDFMLCKIFNPVAGLLTVSIITISQLMDFSGHC